MYNSCPLAIFCLLAIFCRCYLQFYRLYIIPAHLGGLQTPLDPPYGGLLHGGVPEKSWGGPTPPRGGLEKSLHYIWYITHRIWTIFSNKLSLRESNIQKVRAKPVDFVFLPKFLFF